MIKRQFPDLNFAQTLMGSVVFPWELPIKKYIKINKK